MYYEANYFSFLADIDCRATCVVFQLDLNPRVNSPVYSQHFLWFSGQEKRQFVV